MGELRPGTVPEPKHDDERPKRILTLEEMQELLAATESLQMRCLFELMLATGLRIGEALGLTVADLDTGKTRASASLLP